MSKRKHHRKKVAELELQVDQLFAIVCQLATVASQVNEALAIIPAAVGSAIGNHLTSHVALTERDHAAGNGRHVNH